MRNKSKTLPPLNYLQAFEAAAKEQSFVSASRELGISESAISRKVRLLEEFYDVPLFKRGNKSITLTAQGTSFLKTVQPAMQTLRDASARLSLEKSQNDVTLAGTVSVATLWLSPRLHKFAQDNKQVNIMLVSSDDDTECLEENVDLSILRGDGNWPGFDAERLFGEIIFPVCSPAFLENTPKLTDVDTLLELPLIEVTSAHSEWMNWNTWLRGQMNAVPDLIQPSIFNAYPLAIQAAVDGLGVALGWGHLVDHLLKDGSLVRPLGDIQTRTEFGYYMLKRQNCAQNEQRQVVEDWLTGESATRKSYALSG